jgi:hypothetical protein
LILSNDEKNIDPFSCDLSSILHCHCPDQEELSCSLLILNGHVRKTGVQIPIHKEVYEPVLSELKTCGVVFREYEVPYMGYNPDSVAG